MVAGTSHSENLAPVATAAEERSGHSFEWIGRQVDASKSTLHRYCSGESIPPNFGMVEQIALACVAGRAVPAADHGAHPAAIMWTVSGTADPGNRQ
ncbi:helix-turn-helix domain-containing protein [Nonomuraea sp. NPDC049480]|uniref:helix-turn-helix domain-containing protein n=1 Tax=Nonomuraea sp. NPDC049480 TaxID=3364353 RepID=UPI0037A903A1